MQGRGTILLCATCACGPFVTCDLYVAGVSAVFAAVCPMQQCSCLLALLGSCMSSWRSPTSCSCGYTWQGCFARSQCLRIATLTCGGGWCFIMLHGCCMPCGAHVATGQLHKIGLSILQLGDDSRLGSSKLASSFSLSAVGTC
jgi:hypothetical protein